MTSEQRAHGDWLASEIRLARQRASSYRHRAEAWEQLTRPTPATRIQAMMSRAGEAEQEARANVLNASLRQLMRDDPHLFD